MMMTGFKALFYKEILRFWKVAFQTITAPILTSLLYLMIFSHVLESHVRIYPDVSYSSFLVPGLVMMTILQNAFANSSSSLIQSKVTGNIIFVLFPPLSHLEFFGAYACASIVRGIVVGFGVYLVGILFADVHVHSFFWVIVFSILSSALTGVLGIIAGIWAEKFDQLAAFQNFIIMPLTFLSGVFYSIHSLPAFWQGLSHLNPFFYMIDGFRYGFLGHSDVHPMISFTVTAVVLAIVSKLTLKMLESGYKLRS